MEKEKDNYTEKNPNISSLINELARTNDIESYKNRIMKYIKENNKRILVSIKNDKKSFLLLKRTYYLNEFNKIENMINNEELLNKNVNLTNEKYVQLLSFLNILMNFEDFYINKNDAYRSIQLQSKIIKIIKRYLLDKIQNFSILNIKDVNKEKNEINSNNF